MQSITLAPVQLVQFIFLFQMLFGALLIGAQQQSRALMLLFAFQGCVCAFNLLESLKITHYLITPAFTLLYGPLLYFFTLSITGQENKTRSHFIAHSIPSLIALFFTHSTQTIILLGSLSQLGYIYVAYRTLEQFHGKLMQARSDAESLKLKWLIRTLALLSIIIIFDLIRMNVQTVTPPNIKTTWYLLNELLLLLIFSFLLFHTMKTNIQFDSEEIEPAQVPSQPDADDTLLAEQVFKTIDAIIVNELLYQQPRLSLNDLVDKTELSSKEISWAINIAAGKNFCEYINQLRVEEVKREIEHQHSQKLNLMAIAYQAGFNSKSTFNAVFKKVTGLTPSQFKHQTLENSLQIKQETS